MKKTLVLIVLALCGAVNATDVVVRGGAVDCRKSSIFDNAGYAELQVRTQVAQSWMLGVSAGYGRIRMGNQSEVLDEWCGWQIVSEKGGYVSYIPLGLEAIWSTELFGCNVGIEGGLRYNIVHSEAQEVIEDTLWKWDAVNIRDLDMSNFWTCSFGGNLEIPITQRMAAQIGLGYQWADQQNIDTIASHFEGTYLSAGLVFPL